MTACCNSAWKNASRRDLPELQGQRTVAYVRGALLSRRPVPELNWKNGLGLSDEENLEVNPRATIRTRFYGAAYARGGQHTSDSAHGSFWPRPSKVTGTGTGQARTPRTTRKVDIESLRNSSDRFDIPVNDKGTWKKLPFLQARRRPVAE